MEARHDFEEDLQARDPFPGCVATEEEIQQSIRIYFLDPEEKQSYQQTHPISQSGKNGSKKSFRKQYVKGFTQKTGRGDHKTDLANEQTRISLAQGGVTAESGRTWFQGGQENELAMFRKESARCLTPATTTSSEGSVKPNRKGAGDSRRKYLPKRSGPINQQQSTAFNGIMNNLGGFL